MTATLTITLSDDVLAALKASKSITIALGAAAPGGKAAAAPAAGRAPKGGFQQGSLPDRLVKWGQSRKRPFGVPDVMKAMKVKRAHASMLLTRVIGSGHVRRVGRGSYSAA